MTPIQTKPVLYHASPQKMVGDSLLPRPERTCVHHQFLETPEVEAHQGDFIFAGQNLLAAYAYAFKLLDPVRLEPYSREPKPYSYSCSTGVHHLADGSSAAISVIADKEAFLKLLETAEPAIYRMPRDHRFTQVHDRGNRPTGEWIGREAVALAECERIPVPKLEDAMEKGVQFFFLPEGMTKEEWQVISIDQQRQMQEALREQNIPPERRNRFMSDMQLAFLKRMTEEKGLEHYNAATGICPLDLEKGFFSQDKPARFTEQATSAGRGTGQGR